MMNAIKKLLPTHAAPPSDGARRPPPRRRLLHARLSPVGMLAVAAALAAGVAVTERIERPASGAPAVSRAQLDEWRAMVEQASEPN
ncbi:sel1 repeat family protein, partial [Burkholderia pseudomallei]|nr:sel1 repeat family protein [Burkholderia pseudomallei]